MKVILTRDVNSLGKKGAVVEVSDGHARNYLLPRQLAVEATAGALKKVAAQEDAKTAKAAREQAACREQAALLSAKPLVLHAKAGSEGRLFGSITAQDIAAAIQAQCGITVDKRKVELSDAIKRAGTHQVSVRLHPAVTAQVTVLIAATSSEPVGQGK